MSFLNKKTNTHRTLKRFVCDEYGLKMNATQINYYLAENDLYLLFVF